MKRLLIFFVLLATLLPSQGQPKLNTETPIGFFTNFAGRLLQSEMGLDLNHIQIYPTNQYTPAVHRLLQVTANIYDCTTNRADLTDYPYLPTIFRPQFTNDNGTIYITGYVEETGTNVIPKKPLDLLNPNDRANLQPDDNIYGIPLVIGAKKGLPNFNEFSMAAVVQLTRRMQIRKPNLSDNNPAHWEYRTQYAVGISNIFAVEMWNSYGTPFPRAVNIMVTNEVAIILTNDLGIIAQTNLIIGNLVEIGSNVWAGASNLSNPSFSFDIPLITNIAFIPTSVLIYNPPGLSNNPPLNFEANSGINVQNWVLSATNHLRVITVDAVTGKLLDYVQLDGLWDNHSIIRDLGNAGPIGSYSAASSAIWDSTLQAGFPHITRGMFEQIQISLGQGPIVPADWTKYMISAPNGPSQSQAISQFQSFYIGASTNFSMQTPFAPTGELVAYRTWQANDPLVHYISNDLSSPLNTTQVLPVNLGLTAASLLPNLAALNDPFRPWGGNPIKNSDNDPHAFDLAFKDPLITRSDDWSFPTNAPLSFNWLGHVHRGTPWQTIYLKSPAADLNSWEQWTGNYSKQWNNNYFTMDAAYSHPTNDWNLARLMISLLNTNRPQDLFSVNQGNLFQNFAQGLSVLTNITSDTDFDSVTPVSPQFNSVSMLPDSPQAAAILAGRDSQRSLQPGHYFHDPIDILATPELTVNSPWLNQGTSIQLQRGISDAAYEMIPSQILPLLRADSVGTPAIRADGELQLQFTGYDGYPYEVQSSTDLQNWTTIGTQYPTNGTFNLIDPAGASAEHRYYRSVLAP
ncbi:hypothetical protein [Pedosphaera parvula]|nr:hypothetical protein [Pedosphaera parvula]